MSHNDFRTGQKWISSAEPDLGIGYIVNIESRVVSIQFDLIDELRSYARDQAPLTRVRFNVGDRIKTLDGIEITVAQVSEKDQLLIYHGTYMGTQTAVIETDLNPNVTFSKPEERLFTHQTDGNQWFNLRYQTLVQQARLATLEIRGLLGARVSLIPHQYYIANEVASRYVPRVLLADEVGLGKTIEAGLVISQQLTTGRASRVLVIVPPALTFQWFVEMIRRFNLQFTLLDEERCLQIEADNMPEFEDDEPELDNPFEAQQLALCSLDLFLNNPARLTQAAGAEWDLIVVDEAHHLDWQDGEAGEDYLAIETLAREARGLLLLTATPEQLGRLGHFSRLRLLDPSRYHDYEAFLSEEQGYEEVVRLIRNIQDNHAVLNDESRTRIKEKLGGQASTDDDELVRSLLDRHGTGRVLFRNVRESVAGFPARTLKTYDMDPELFPRNDAENWQESDPRTDWLVELAQNSEEKMLVICHRAETAIALEKYIRDRTPIRSAAFHEGMDLIARDRAANYFADTDRGAQLLICSEIGSEGRNFQFAHHLVMYDLPASPDLVEQRIGRLDRIGQQQDIEIHVPVAKGSMQSRLLQIFDEGLRVFSAPNATAQLIFDGIDDLSQDIGTLVQQVKEENTHRLESLSQGRDRLIELNSHQPERSARLLELVSDEDASGDLETYLEASFELYGLESEPLGDDIHLVKPTEGMVRHQPVSAETQDRLRYPELPDEGLSFTYNRETALAREDVQFLTWEHPIAEQALELVTSNITGNCTFIVVKAQGIKTGTMLLESLHVIDCIAPSHLGAVRYLPPTVVRSMVSVEGADIADKVAFQTWPNTIDLDKASTAKILNQQEPEIRKLVRHAESAAMKKFEPIRQNALRNLGVSLGEEISRMTALSEVNPNIREEEIEYLKDSLAALGMAINQSQIRLDAVRLLLFA